MPILSRGVILGVVFAVGACKQCHSSYREGGGVEPYRFTAASGITPP
jgi:hypothetical protein